MRETMAGSLAAVKKLNLGFSRNPRDNAGPMQLHLWVPKYVHTLH